MSLSLRDRLTVVIAPEGLRISLRQRGWRMPDKDLGFLAVAAGDDSGDGMGVLHMLERWLAQTRWQWTDVNVLVSDAYTRYVLLPWTDGIHRSDEMMAFVRMQFDLRFGLSNGVAIAWHISRFGQNGIACAIGQAFLDKLKQVFASRQIRLLSVQPRFIATFNTWRARVVDHGLLATVEAGLSVMAVIRDKQFCGIRMVPLNGDLTPALRVAIDRELALYGESEQTRVYLDLHAKLDLSALQLVDGIQILGRGAASQTGTVASLAGETV